MARRTSEGGTLGVTFAVGFATMGCARPASRSLLAVRSQNIQYIVGVDHIRAFASLLVVFHHSFWLVLSRWNPPGLTPDHWVSTWNPFESLVIETHIVVSLFFVLSGFVFTMAGDGKDIAYGPFMRNRILRVFPLYLTLIFFAMAVFPERTHLVGVLSSATILGNTMAGANYWPISTTFWTVAIELQFYLIFPFLNTFFNREGAKPLLFLVLFVVGLRLCGFLITSSMRDLNYWHIVGRLDSFILGMFAARWYLRRNLESMSPLWFLPALALFFGTTQLLNRLGGFPVQAWWKALWPTVEALACTAFVLTYVVACRALPHMISRGFAWLGELSFSTYLLHFMILQGMFDAGLLPDFRAALGLGPVGDAVANALFVVMPLTVLLATLAYNGIEAPFMRLRGRYVRPKEPRGL